MLNLLFIDGWEGIHYFFLLHEYCTGSNRKTRGSKIACQKCPQAGVKNKTPGLAEIPRKDLQAGAINAKVGV
ncbi:MAG: hypothetical protein K9K81_08070 [Desulfobacteraceae bacterium]|nr:hypothetical protein [Desulfobacteraceae bacterium]